MPFNKKSFCSFGILHLQKSEATFKFIISKKKIKIIELNY